MGEIRKLLFVRLACCAALLVGLVGATGCGGRDMPLVKVHGRITFDGGPCPTKGRMMFNPIPGTGLEGQPLRPGRGSFDVDGNYEATSFDTGDGLLPGTYEVRIICMRGEPGVDGHFNDLTYVPVDYEPEKIVVEPDARSIEMNYDIPLANR